MRKIIYTVILLLIVFYNDSVMGCNYCKVPQAYADEDSLIQKADSIFLVLVKCPDITPHFFLEKILKGKAEKLKYGDELPVYDVTGKELQFCDEMKKFTLVPLDNRIVLLTNKMANGTYRIAHSTRCALWPVSWNGCRPWEDTYSPENSALEAKKKRGEAEQFIDSVVSYEKASQIGIVKCFDLLNNELANRKTFLYALKYLSSEYSIFNKPSNEKEKIFLVYLAFKHLNLIMEQNSFSIENIERFDRVCMYLPHQLYVKYQLWRLTALNNRKLRIDESSRVGKFVNRLFLLMENEHLETSRTNKDIQLLKKQWDNYIDKLGKAKMGSIPEKIYLDNIKCNDILAQCAEELCNKWRQEEDNLFIKRYKLNIFERDCYKEIVDSMKIDMISKPDITLLLGK